MQLNNVSYSKPSFKSTIVTLSKVNHGEDIKRDIVGTFNDFIVTDEFKKDRNTEARAIIDRANKTTPGEYVGRVISEPSDFQNKVNFFVLAAGAGSRFAPLAHAVAGGKDLYNKISTPFQTDTDRPLHMLDFALMQSKSCIDDKVECAPIQPNKTGSLGDVILWYKNNPDHPIKDTIVCCGDNVFGAKSSEIMTFMTRVINDPTKNIALVGAKRTPEVAAKRFGVLKVASEKNEDGSYKLQEFQEKPELDKARKLAVDDGNVIANTGLFYISADAMKKLILATNYDPDFIRNKKDKEGLEQYDFAMALQKIHENSQSWFGIKGEDTADVLAVDKWEDVGEPVALYRFLNDLKDGTFLQNFPKGLKALYKDAMKDRVKIDFHAKRTPDGNGVSLPLGWIDFRAPGSPKLTPSEVEKAPSVDGVKVVIDTKA